MKAIWINPLTTGATSLDVSINPHDVDQLAVSSLLEKEGYEVWLHNVFVKKGHKSSWPRQVTSEELKGFKADVAILYCGPFTVDYVGHRYEVEKGTSRANRLDLVTEWLDDFDGKVYLHITDPRPPFQQLFLKPRGEHGIMKHIDRATLLVADDAFLDESLRPRASISDYWKVVTTGDIQRFCPIEDFFCVYPGSKPQSRTRKKLIKDWMNVEGCGTIGEINVPGLKSLSEYKKVPLSTVIDMTQRSATSLVCGEDTHTWLTPRVVQSMTSGTVCSFHPTFRGFETTSGGDDFLWCHTARDAQDSPRTRELYDVQVDYIKWLRSGDCSSGV